MSTRVVRRSLTVATRGRGFVDVGADVAAIVADSGVVDGLCTVFVHHTSASLLIQENADPDVRRDLEAWFARLVIDGDALFRHRDEGDDDMSAHIRAALTATSLGIPVAGGCLDLGRWQALYLWEHRTSPHARRLSVVVVGD
jgi:secondary thiamine-phosphate synthase enzyme